MGIPGGRRRQGASKRTISGRECSLDSLFDGRLQCLQHRRGYRFSIDAVLLAHFIKPKPGDHILDLGAGCGIISLILAYRWPSVTVAALEIQAELAGLLRRSLALNARQGRDYQERLRVVTGDLREIKRCIEPGSCQWVVCNPPYRKQAAGRLNTGTEQALARHELNADLAAVVRAAAVAVKNRGRVAMVYPAGRGAVLMHALKDVNLEPKRLRTVYSYPGGDGKLLLLEAMKGGGEELRIMPPFYIYQEPKGVYSPEMARCFAA